MKMVSDWKQAWKWVSVNCMALAGVLQASWMFIPDDMRATLPQHMVEGITIFILILGIVGRLMKQGGENAGS